MTPNNNARKTTPIRITLAERELAESFFANNPIIHNTRAERERAMNTLIAARLTSSNCPQEIIDTATAVARTLYTDGHSAFRAMRLALGMAERLQLTRQPTNPGPQAA